MQVRVGKPFVITTMLRAIVAGDGYIVLTDYVAWILGSWHIMMVVNNDYDWCWILG